jgi:cold-inducible RNA-binding protein
LKNIFVGNLDYDTTEDDLRTMFEAHGPVEGVRIMTDRDTGRSRGFAFVEMTNDPDADRAIAELNGAALRGRALNVNEARPKPDRAGGGRFGGGAGAGGGGGFRKPGGGGGAGGGRGRGRGPRW